MLKKIKALLQKPSSWLMISILGIAAYLRLYKIDDYMTFLGDEGRDVLIAKHILEGNLTLLGPRSSAGDFFYGPIYYYLVAPSLWLFNYDPVGPAVMVALISVATVWLVYKIGTEFFGRTAAIIAAFLYAISPVTIIYAHSSWNPNPLPFFSLLTLYLLYKAHRNKSWKLFLFVGFLLGVCIQLQYLTIFLIVIVFSYIASELWFVKKTERMRLIIKRYFLITAGFFIGWSPFFLFEIRHEFLNTKTIIGFLLRPTFSGDHVINRPFLETVWDAFFRLFGRLLSYFPLPVDVEKYSPQLLTWWSLALVILAICSVIALLKIKNTQAKLLFSLWFFIGIGLFGFYKKEIYDYYFGFLFPLPFLLVGNLFEQMLAQKKRYRFILSGLVVMSMVLLSVASYNHWPTRFPANRQKEQARTIANFVLSKTDGKPFNFALLTRGNSDHAYRYFLEVAGRPAVQIDNMINDPERKTVTDQLLIVCEDSTCQPLGHPLFDVAAFGRGEVEGVWEVSVVKVYKLGHYAGKE